MDIRRQKQSIMDRNMFRFSAIYVSYIYYLSLFSFWLLIGLQIKALLRERNVNNENA